MGVENSEELRNILLDKDMALEMADFFVKKLSEEEDFSDVISEIYSEQFKSNIETVFQYAESPIELIFFNSLIFNCIKSDVMIMVSPPSLFNEDFQQDIEAQRDYYKNLYKCYTFYENLPNDARPKTFLRFLEITGVESGGLTLEQAKFMDVQVTMQFKLCMFHAINLILQPSFKNLSCGKKFRTDAVIWIPSDNNLRLVIECDGFSTHSDKESFSNDRQRDRIFQSMGYLVRRYSGVEIYDDPIAASDDLFSFLAEQEKVYFESKESWEEQVISESSMPSASVIDSWRKRMLVEQANNF